jgi:hypothetical protein
MRKTWVFVVVGLSLFLSAAYASAARLPVVGSDNNAWGTILNQYLNVSHSQNGSIRLTTNSTTQNNNTEWVFNHTNMPAGIFAALFLEGGTPLSQIYCLTTGTNCALGGGGNSTEEMVDAVMSQRNESIAYHDAADDWGVNRTWLNDTIDARTASVLFNASEIVTVTGTLDSGNLSSIQVLQDGQTYNVSEASGANPLTVIINFSGVDDFDQVIFRERYIGGAGHELIIGLYDFDANQWTEEFGEITDMGIFTTTVIDIFNAASHVSSWNNVSLRFRHEQVGNPAHDFIIDYAALNSGFTTLTNAEHDSLTGRDSNDNHPWAMPRDGTKNMSGNIWILNATPLENDTYSLGGDQFWWGQIFVRLLHVVDIPGFLKLIAPVQDVIGNVTVTGNVTINGTITLAGNGPILLNHSIDFQEDMDLGDTSFQILFLGETTLYGRQNVSGGGQGMTHLEGNNIRIQADTQSATNNGSVEIMAGRNSGNLTLVPGWETTDTGALGFIKLIADSFEYVSDESGIWIENLVSDTLGRIIVWSPIEFKQPANFTDIEVSGAFPDYTFSELFSTTSLLSGDANLKVGHGPVSGTTTTAGITMACNGSLISLSFRAKYATLANQNGTVNYTVRKNGVNFASIQDYVNVGDVWINNYTRHSRGAFTFLANDYMGARYDRQTYSGTTDEIVVQAVFQCD